MKKSELKVGEEYALGSASRYDRFNLTRAKVIEIDGERRRRSGTMQKGIVVQFLGKPAYPYYNHHEGEEVILDSARLVRQPWAEYVEKKREHDERQRKREAERAQTDKLGWELVEKLREMGFPANKDYGSGLDFSPGRAHFLVNVDQMAALVERMK